MTTLALNDSLGAVAHILRAAQVLGPDGWGGEGRRARRVAAGEEPELSRDLLQLFTLLRDRQVPYLLVGGVALLKYIDGRNTEDIDLLLSLESLQRLPEILVAERNRDFARGKYRSIPVDVLLTENPLFHLVQQRYSTQHRFLEMDVSCATVEGLLLLKLYALPSLYQQGDGQRIALYEADITMLCQRYRPPTEPLLMTLEPFLAAGQIDELRRILVEVEQRIQRMESKKQGK